MKPEHPLDKYQDGYDKFDYQSCKSLLQFREQIYINRVLIDENFPDGLPRVAAFLESCDSFGIYRKFAHSHARLLLSRMSNITDIERQLAIMDAKDEAGGPTTQWQLKCRECFEGFDTEKKDLLKRLEEEVMAYGMNSSWGFPRPYSHGFLLDALLFNHHRLKNLDQTPRGDHDSLFRWLWRHKPLANGEFDWIFYPRDCVSLLSPRRNRFEKAIVEHLEKWPSSFLQVGAQ